MTDKTVAIDEKEVVVEGTEVLTQAEITAVAVENYREFASRLTGANLDAKQARMLMDASITQPMRTIEQLSEEHGIELDGIRVALPFGIISFSFSEAVTGKPGEAKEKVLDAEGNPILKGRLKIKLSKAVSEEALLISGWEQEGLPESVESRRDAEAGKLEQYEEGNQVVVTVADTLGTILAKEAAKYVNEIYGFDMSNEVLAYEEEEVTEGEDVVEGTEDVVEGTEDVVEGTEDVVEGTEGNPKKVEIPAETTEVVEENNGDLDDLEDLD